MLPVTLPSRLNKLNNTTRKVCETHKFDYIEVNYNKLTLIVPAFMLEQNPTLSNDVFKGLVKAVLTFLRVQLMLAKF